MNNITLKGRLLHKNMLHLIYKIKQEWGVLIKKLSRKRKDWLLKKSKKEMRRRTSYNKRRKRYVGNNGIISHINEYGVVNEHDNVYSIDAPERLSICDNFEETIRYFNGYFNDMQKRIAKRRYKFEIENIKYLTNDALMYILAIVYNIRNNKVYRFGFEGSIPDDKDAKKLFEESGFLNYVNSRVRKISPTNTKLQILSGEKTDNEAAGKIIDFARKAVGLNKIVELKALYRVLIELMSNTTNHAYGNRGPMEKSWYIFAEQTTDRVKFVFLDTGQGIPSTMRKRGLKEWIGTKRDQTLLYSSFTERFRSRTKHSNRGHGLPGTYAICKKSLLCNFTVISGRGKCIIGEEDELVENKEKLYGTLYYWELR